MALVREARPIERIQPWIGALLLTLGLSQGGLMALTMKAPTLFQAAFGVLGLCGAGLTLIQRRVSDRARLWRFVLGALLLAGLVVGGSAIKQAG